MKNLLVRSLSGIVFLVIVLGSVFIGSTVFQLLMLAFSLLGLKEFTNFRPQTFTNSFDHRFLLVCGFFVFTIFNLVQTKLLDPNSIYLLIIVVLAIILITLLKNPAGSVTKIAETIFGLIYIVVPFFIMTEFYQNDTPSGLPELLIGFFVILWFNDVFAYLVGSFLGRTKLFEKVSPKKTWEGTIGGMVLSVLSAYFISTLFLSLNLTNWLVIGLIISIFATLGDLTESMFKRQANIKDSGNIMPGHGGVLDRFDGLLLAAPAVYLYLTMIN